MKSALFTAVLLLFGGILQAAEDPVKLSSVDGKIALSVVLASGPGGSGRPTFRAAVRGRELFRGKLGLSVSGADILERAVFKASPVRENNTTFVTPFGKSNRMRDQFRELTLEAQLEAGPVRAYQVVFRVYRDGVAFRYVIPEQAGVESVEVTDETGSVEFMVDGQAWPLYLENFTTSHEALYTSSPVSQLTTNKLIDLPLLIETSAGPSVAITEANLRNYAGMYLQAEGTAEQGATRRRLRSVLSPLPKAPGVKVRSRLPLASPWRVFLIGDRPGDLIESNLILSLNEPNAIGDISWLKAGKATWYWWNGPYQEPVKFHVGMNWETMKHYIDFCARNGITFHSIMSTEDGYPWYHQTHHGYDPGEDSDVTRPRAGFPMERVAEYARSKGVLLRLWVHWKPLSDRLEQAFAQYEKWGVAGLMVDFLDRDDQEMMLFVERVLQTAARHHLHIHFHGIAKPTGLERTYPNLFNHEGVLNLEYLKWSDQCTPEHNVTVPFTRMLAGPMDYHLGGFHAVKRDQFKPVNERPSVLGTRCHHLAMYVVYDNPMPMVCDAPSAYENQPGFDFIRQVPSSWDETRVVSAKVGDYIVSARRQGVDWYLGAMTDWTPRQLEVPLDFLSAGKHRIEIWADAADSSDPNSLIYYQRTVNAGETLALRLNGGGGQAVRIRPVR